MADMVAHLVVESSAGTIEFLCEPAEASGCDWVDDIASVTCLKCRETYVALRAHVDRRRYERWQAMTIARRREIGLGV